MESSASKTPETMNSGQPAPEPVRIPKHWEWMWNWHMPGSLNRLMPRWLLHWLRHLKGMALTSEIPRHLGFEQSLEDALASASFSIVVPIHDSPMVTCRCLASLERYASKAEIILVDDASSLGETLDVIWAFSRRNGWKVIRHEKPLGHSASCGAGAALATQPYLCLLNSDTVATPWCWRQLKEVFENREEIGVAGPSTSHCGTPQVLTVARNLRAYWNDNQICGFAHRLLKNPSEPVLMDLPWVSGFAFFIRLALWQELGGFDPNLPDYGNEVELCHRVKEKGHRVVWVRNSYIHHFGQQSYEGRIGGEGIMERIQAAKAYMESKGSKDRGTRTSFWSRD